MTIQEAITDLEARIKRLKEIIENGEYGCVDIETWEKFTAQVERYELYFSALCEKQAREQGGEECLHYEPYFTPPPYPCNECLRSKSDMWQSNAAQPQEGEKA